MSDKESQESQEEEKVEETKAEAPVEESQESQVSEEKVEESEAEAPVEESQESQVSEEKEKVEESKVETPAEETKTEEEPINVMKISELSPFDRKLQVLFVVVGKGESRSIVSRKTNEEHQLADVTVGDDSGVVTCTLWDETIDKISEGSTYILKNGYVNVFQGQMRLALGKWGSIEDTEEVIALDSVNSENDRSKEQHEDRRRRPSYNRGGDSGGYGGGDRGRSSSPRGREDKGGYRGKPSNQDRW